MIATVARSAVNGMLEVPASKSVMQRACALGLLNNGQTIIHNAGKSDDDLSAINIIRALGATAELQQDDLKIFSDGFIKVTGGINCGESGLALRMFAPIAALSETRVVLSGRGSLLKRPIHFNTEIYSLLNVNVSSQEGFLPVTISGPLIPTDISIDASQSSQYLTGLLFAFAKAATKPVTIVAKNLKSKPYIDLSIEMLIQFGYKVYHEDYKTFHVDPVRQPEQEIHFDVEGDWSGASFLLVAGALSGAVKLQGLRRNSMQADRAILTVLKMCGADIHLDEDYVSVNQGNHLRPFTFDARDCPDLFPPLVALASGCHGQSIIRGISRLVNKESNRAETLIHVFTKMGLDIFTRDDEMVINGIGNIKGGFVSSHHDHRIAMACAVAGLNAESPVIIHHAEAVSKSYPDFYHDLKKIGATVSLAAG